MMAFAIAAPPVLKAARSALRICSISAVPCCAAEMRIAFSMKLFLFAEWEQSKNFVMMRRTTGH
jgi:hypothetical protein